MVCKLKKSLYELKQSPRQWYKYFDNFIRGERYTRSHYDSCIYYNKLPDGEYVYLLLYVDDMLIASRSRSTIDKLKKQLSFEFEMKDLGEAEKVLGMKIERDRKSGKIYLTQKRYLKKVFQRFNINSDTKSVSTPLASHFKLKDTMSPTTVEERAYICRVPYASAVDSLMYAMVCIMPNLSQDVSMVSRYMHTVTVWVIGASEVDFIIHQRYHKCWLGAEKDTMGKQSDMLILITQEILTSAGL